MKQTSTHASSSHASVGSRLRTLFIGKPKDPLAPGIFHKVSLVAFLAWIGLGADGLSSSAYGPDEAFRALGTHTYLALGLAAATAFTVFIISYAYSRIIEHFPSGGGGYVVATKLLGAEFGLVSGSALLVDYVLTISTSVAAAADASFSFLPHTVGVWKVPLELAVIGLFMVMNLRGVKESVTVMIPVFMLFIATHLVLILGVIALRAGELGPVTHQVHAGLSEWLARSGLGRLRRALPALLHARRRHLHRNRGGFERTSDYARAAGRDRAAHHDLHGRVVGRHRRRHSALLSTGPCDAGRGANDERRARGAFRRGLPLGQDSPGPLVHCRHVRFRDRDPGYCCADRLHRRPARDGQHGADSWLPHSFSHLSEQLTMHNGVMLMSGAAILTLVYTWGETSTLVLLYSINVFLTFSLSQAGMVRYWFRNRAKHPDWRHHIIIHLIGLVLCFSILVVSLIEKFREGGWVTVVVTTAVIALCLYIRRHYREAEKGFRALDEMLPEFDSVTTSTALPPRDTDAPTAVCFVNGFNGLGIQSVLAIPLLFGTQFENFVFVGLGAIDSSRFKGEEEIDNLRHHTEEELKKYVALVNQRGYCAEYHFALGTDPIDGLERLAHEVAERFPRAVFFAGKRIFQRERLWHKVLHNQAAYTIERRLQFAGFQTVVLSVRAE